MRKILVTGSGGFIGTHLMSQLHTAETTSDIDVVSWNQKRDGTLLNHSNIERVLNEHNPDVVLHLAWANTSGANYDSDIVHQDWADVSLDLILTCRKRGVYVIVIGSIVDTQESSASNSNYVASKIELRSKVDNLLQFGNVTLIRPHYILSPSHLRPRIAQLAHDSLLTGAPFLPSSPDAFVDYVHVKDVASGIWMIMLNELDGVQDISSGTLRNPYEIASAMGRFLNLENQDKFVLNAKHVPGTVNRALTSFGWVPKYTEDFFSSS